MFEPDPAACGSLLTGTLYAVCGESEWRYYCQITPRKAAGFFRRRDHEIAAIPDIVATPVMSVFSVGYPSIGRAVRSGCWKRIGRSAVADALQARRGLVQWPVGRLDVFAMREDGSEFATRIDDPTIQQYEIIGSWDAEYHVPARLTADFDDDDAAWHVGGPVWRERRVREEEARRWSKDQPWHALPEDWVLTGLPQ